MTPIEEEIRAALRAEGERLRPIPPLRLPPPGIRQRRSVRLTGSGGRARLAGLLGNWLVPALAGAIVVLVAISVVTVRALDGGAVASHARPSAPVPAIVLPKVTPISGTPRYYVSLAGLTDNFEGTSLVVGDALTGARLATIPAPKGAIFIGSNPAGAADDRTFVVGEADHAPASHPPVSSTQPYGWYLVRISPGATPQVTMTRLPIQTSKADGIVGGTGESGDVALSPDGTKLAVLYTHSPTNRYNPDTPIFQQVLRVYSVSTGQLLGTWPEQAQKMSEDLKQASDLSWVGNASIGFEVTWHLDAHLEMRTVDVTAGGTDLLAGSRVVWSQYEPIPPGEMYTDTTPQTCHDPFLTQDGQAVVCTNSYPLTGKHRTSAWWEYPVSAPTSPRLLGMVAIPADEHTSIFASVEWVNATGTQAIGQWTEMIEGQSKDGVATTTMQNHVGVASGGGTVRALNTGTYKPTNSEGW